MFQSKDLKTNPAWALGMFLLRNRQHAGLDFGARKGLYQSCHAAGVGDSTPALEGGDVQVKHIDLAIAIQVAHPVISGQRVRARCAHIAVYICQV